MRRRTRTGFSWWQMLFLVGGVVMIFAAWTHFSESGSLITNINNLNAAATPTLPTRLNSRDVLLTLTPDPQRTLQQLIFPAAHLVAPIVLAVRNGPSWETRNLGASVGYLQGTSWLDGPGNNTVLAGHVEDSEGRPGPFAFLAQARIGDVILVRDGKREAVYRVTQIDHAAPNDIGYVSQEGKRRITLITCADWDARAGAYRDLLVVIAEVVAQT